MEVREIHSNRTLSIMKILQLSELKTGERNIDKAETAIKRIQRIMFDRGKNSKNEFYEKYDEKTEN